MESLRDKRVAVIGDSDLVCKAIKRALQARLHMEMADPGRCDATGSPGEPSSTWDLVIVAIASEGGEPIAELARAFLIDCVGRVPLMIVSSRPFETFAEFGLSHFRFPFEPDQLCMHVEALLNAGEGRSQAATL